MHQVGFVERVAIELLVERLAHEDLRSLGDPREEFVGRVGGEDHRLFGLGAIRADRVHVFVEVMECGMGQPGFVEMERADASVEHRAELLDVVEDPVVGALSDGQNSGLAIRVLGLRFLGKRIGVDFALDALERELILGNRTDDPQVKKTGTAPVMMIEWRIDLWQLRSTTTMSPLATVECQTILFDVEVPLVTKKQ